MLNMNPTTPTTTVETVTPDLATEWLANMPVNRTVKKAKVNEYARDMMAGDWRMTGESIKFASTGELLDGQHRLLAVEQSGEPVQMLIVRGLEASAQLVMDTGVKRSGSDQLQMRGVTAPSRVAATANMYARYKAGMLKTAGDECPMTITHSELIAIYEANPTGFDEAARVGARLRRVMPFTPRCISTAWLLTQEVSPEDSTEFFRRIGELETYGSGDPIAALIRRATSDQVSRVLLPPAAPLFMILRSWNAVRLNETLNKVVWQKNGVGPATMVKPV